tara:strand:- start:23 stop:484 length:462 start_codon:yes stop_codon:yes gene_type:complete
MGLDHYLYLVKAYPVWYEPCAGTVDGFPLESHRMQVHYWRCNNWVHHWFCANVSEAAHDCQEIELEPEQLAQLADKLEAWADDPEALPPAPAKFRGGICGPRPTDGHYESERDHYRAEAKDQAKKIRKAVEWLKVPLDRSEREYRYATYRASW